jgi:hypothetical protein
VYVIAQETSTQEYATVLNEITAAYPPNHLLFAIPAPIPGQPLMWAFMTANQAHHFIGYCKTALPALRFTVFNSNAVMNSL